MGRDVRDSWHTGYLAESSRTEEWNWVGRMTNQDTDKPLDLAATATSATVLATATSTKLVVVQIQSAFFETTATNCTPNLMITCMEGSALPRMQGQGTCGRFAWMLFRPKAPIRPAAAGQAADCVGR